LRGFAIAGGTGDERPRRQASIMGVCRGRGGPLSHLAELRSAATRRLSSLSRRHAAICARAVECSRSAGTAGADEDGDRPEKSPTDEGGGGVADRRPTEARRLCETCGRSSLSCASTTGEWGAGLSSCRSGGLSFRPGEVKVANSRRRSTLRSLAENDAGMTLSPLRLLRMSSSGGGSRVAPGGASFRGSLWSCGFRGCARRTGLGWGGIGAGRGGAEASPLSSIIWAGVGGSTLIAGTDEQKAPLSPLNPDASARRDFSGVTVGLAVVSAGAAWGSSKSSVCTAGCCC